MTGIEFAAKLIAYHEKGDDYRYVLTKAEAEEVIYALNMVHRLNEEKFNMFMNEPT